MAEKHGRNGHLKRRKNEFCIFANICVKCRKYLESWDLYSFFTQMKVMSLYMFMFEKLAALQNTGLNLWSLTFHKV